MSTAKIVQLPNSNQITYHFHNKSSRVSVDAPWSELSGSNTNTDTSSLSPFCLQKDGENCRGPGTGKDYRGDAIGTRETSWDIPTGKTGLPSEQFHFFWEFSSRANRKSVFHLAPNRNFCPNGKRPRSLPFLIFNKKQHI